jgi:hypothetical protein
LLAQQRLWQDASELGGLMLDNQAWTTISIEEWPIAAEIFEFLQAFTTEGSEDAAGLSFDEREVMLQLPRPSNIQEADITALIDRFDRLNRDQLTREELNIDAIKVASDNYTDTATELENRGWKDPTHGVTSVLLQLANEQDKAFQAGGTANLSSLSVTTAATSRRPHSIRSNVYYLLTNLETRFEQRGRLGLNGKFSGLILAPDTLYQVEYADPSVGQTGTTAFVSGSAGTSVNIPRSILGSDDSTDADSDGLSDQTEKVLGTNPSNPDSDNDGVSDGGEILQGTNPLDGFPAATGIIASAAIPGTATDLEVINDLILTASGAKGVYVLTQIAGGNPIIIANVLTDGPATSIAASDTHAVVTVSNLGVVIIDITDGANPTVTKVLEMDRAQEVEIAGDFVYIASNTEIVLYDIISDTIIDQRSYSDVEVHDLQAAFGSLYVLSASTGISGKHSLHKIVIGNSLTDPSSQIEISGSDHPTFGRMHLAVGNELVYVGAADNNEINQVPGVEIFSDDENGLIQVGPPSPITAFDVATTGSGLVLFNGADPMLLSNADVGVLDVSDPSMTDQFLVSYNPPGSVLALTILSRVKFCDSQRTEI